MTKKERKLYQNYFNSNITDLEQIYNNPSKRKINAFNKCIEEMIAHNGFDHRICSYNSMVFTFAYRYVDYDGNIRLAYHTHKNRYCFVVE